MTHTETPEQTALRCARELRESLRRAGRNRIKFRGTADGFRLTLTVRAEELRPSMRRVLHVLREIRSRLGAAAKVKPSDILQHLSLLDPDGDIPSYDTVNHALRDLRDRGLARRDAVLWWVAVANEAE